MVYLGGLLYIIWERKGYNISRIIGLIIFLGGFIFQLFWEAKSSYALMYFVMLIPYAVIGYDKCFERIQNTIIAIKKFVLGVCWCFYSYGHRKCMIINNDNEKWDAYLSEH